MYKLVFFVPEDSCEKVKESVFGTGAGKLGNYEKCSWQTLGEGQFLALNDANPQIGSIGTLKKLNEYKVEILCSKENIKDAIKEMILVHPYEEPAYEVLSVQNLKDFE